MDETERRGNHTDATEFHTDAVRNKNQIYSQRREGRHNMFPLYPLLKRYIYPRIEDFIWKTEIYSLYKSWYAKKFIVPEGTKVWFVPLVPSVPSKAKPPCSDLHSYSFIRHIFESSRYCFRQPGIFFWSQPIYPHFSFSEASWAAGVKNNSFVLFVRARGILCDNTLIRKHKAFLTFVLLSHI